MPVREFRVLKTLGGCGGTIVSRAFAANGAVVLSEVNPRSARLFAGALNPLPQVIRDYPELLPPIWHGADMYTLSDPEIFGRFISDIADLSERPLLIRDYSYVDYIGVPFMEPHPELSSLEAALRPFGSVRTMLLVRRPWASLQSLLRHAPLTGTLSLEEYIKGHIAFVKQNVRSPLMRFEEFFTGPVVWMRSACHHLSIPYKSTWIDDLARAPRLTGNAQAMTSSVILPADRANVDQEIIPDSLSVLHKELLSLCGYE